MIPSRLSAGMMLFLALPPAVHAAPASGNAAAGRELVLRSCTSCHATENATSASDTAPPLSFISRDIKDRRVWVRGWLMNPHPPMRGINLSRQEINDVIAYLETLPSR
jgi:mono/diheme cytochrome c family protein